MSTSTQRMIGRTAEIEQLRLWLDSIGRGQAVTALLEGEAGIGKSLMLSSVGEAAAERSLQVFRGGADELDQTGPFGPLIWALGNLPGADRSREGTGAEFRTVDRLVELVESRALTAPVVIVIDDLQWADRETIVALRAIGRRLAHLPIGLLGGFRPFPRNPELETLAESWSREGGLRLTLTALHRKEVGELAARAIGARPGSTLATQLESASGNPLFVGELLGALLDDGAIHVDDGVAEVEAAALPPSLQLTILRRISMLGDDTVRLLQTASLLGSLFSLRDLATVTQLDLAALIEALQEARRAAVIQESGELLGFRHDLVREALYDDLPAGARRALHRQSGLLLASAGAPVQQVAEQLSLGAEPGDAEAVGWLARAARESALRAPRRAAELFERALALASPGDPGRDGMMLELAETLVWSGRPHEAQSLAERMLLGGSLEPEMRERARATVTRALWLESRWQELVVRAEEWLAPDELSAGRRGLLLADLAMACFFVGDHARGQQAAVEALAIGERLGDEAVIFGALYAQSPLCNARGDYAGELEASTRALAIAQRGQNPDLTRFQPHFAQAMSLNSNDRYAEADEMFRLGLRLREELGTIWDLPLYQAGLADLHCQMGDWDAALAEAETGVAVADEVGTRLGVAVCASIAALIHAHRDSLGEARRFLDVAEDQISRHGPQWGTAYWTCLARAQVAEAGGDPAGALNELERSWEQQSGAPGLRAYLGPELIRLALVHNPDLVPGVSAELQASAPELSVASARGSTLLARGRAERDVEVLEQAVAAFASSGWVLQHAAALEALALERVAQGGDAATIRTALESALERYQGLGAQRDAGRVLAAMRAAGIRRGSRAAHRQALKGWDALTVTEAEVVRLCVDGLTNRQIGERLFISRRTVQTHLSHAFTKLEVSSRVGLAALAARRHLPPADLV